MEARLTRYHLLGRFGRFLPAHLFRVDGFDVNDPNPETDDDA